jgi:peptidoglycan/xylan/chitin deacetylase (PgdA/CDA1 family)
MNNPHRLLLVLFSALTACGPVIAPGPTQPRARFDDTVVSLTFDDGDADNFAIRSVLAQNQLQATWYIVSGFIDTPGYMTEAQLRELYQAGHEIGGHSLNHTKLTEVRGAKLRGEVCQDRLNLLALGFRAASFAYPYGHYDGEAQQTVKECGYNSARIVTGGPDTIPPEDPFAFRAMPYVVTDVRLPKMQRYVSQVAEAGGGWVIFVFHHICDDCDQYSIERETFAAFADWLGAQRANGLVVKTIGDVMGGALQPGVEP